ncbi:MAG: calcium/sodium antiporter [Schleiferiaceae bacterium]|nr:calcium/sodium antiporter [Schleiferiaceae bacterium]MDR9442973.1 calcium/sodium antiporter [Schleiferiaceae bacterium]
MPDYLYLLLGLAMLLMGGEWLVKAAVDIALRSQISLLVVGMTVVSFATSAPELLVSVEAAVSGYLDLSFGNVLGSNMANLALVLGITALLMPIGVSEKTITRDYWIMALVTGLLFVLLLDGALVFWEGALLVALLVLYILYQIRSSSRSDIPDELQDAKLYHPALMVFFLLGGMAGLHFGSDFLVTGAVGLARTWGISERIIGITMVSIGTSLPELAASISAIIKKRQDISLGNLVGSNIFNILAVLGITSLIQDLTAQSPALLRFDFPWLLGITLLLYPLIAIFGRGQLSRWQGGLMLGAYLLYMASLFWF